MSFLITPVSAKPPRHHSILMWWEWHQELAEVTGGGSEWDWREWRKSRRPPGDGLKTNTLRESVTERTSDSGAELYVNFESKTSQTLNLALPRCSWLRVCVRVLVVVCVCVRVCVRACVCCKALASAKPSGTIWLFSVWFLPPAEAAQQTFWRG